MALSESIAHERVDKKCTEKNIKFKTFDFIGIKRTKILLECYCGYEWETTYDAFINGNKGCAKCAGNLPLTQNEAELKVSLICEENNLTFKQFTYTTALKTRLHIICNCGNCWEVSYNNFVNKKRGCPKCKSEKNRIRCRLSQNDATYYVEEKCKIKNYSFKPFTYVNNSTVIELSCECGQNWKCKYSNLVNNDRGCPKCAKYGFNPSKPAYFYIHKIIGFDNTIYYKYGISNDDKRRFNEYKNNLFKTEREFLYYCENGNIIQSVESCIKKNKEIISGVLTKENFSVGYTETINVYDLYKILYILDNTEQLKKIY